MLGMMCLGYFMLAGVVIAWALMPRHTAAVKVYMGMTAGLGLMMWLPSIVAFLTGFTLWAQYGAMTLMGALVVAAWVWRIRNRRDAEGMPPPSKTPEHPPMALTLALVVPFLALSAYLLNTHTILDVDGALHVGQSTYGDLSLHLGIATGLQNAKYPPEYTLLPGTLLGYPFLADAMCATMMMLGTSLRMAFVASSFVMMGLVYWGFVIFAWKLTKSRRAVAIAFLLLFMNGGLGFLYMMDGLPSNASKFWQIFTGFYQTPTNMPELNLRWVNVICDLMIPQRTLLAGWMMVIPAIGMLHHALLVKRRSAFIALGIWAGLMPMIHTHSFLALGLISVGTMGVALWQSRPEARKETLFQFLWYGGIAVGIALPQLVLWTFPQSIHGDSLGFLFNWVNWNGHGLIDGYLWFWVKNVGLIYLLMVPAAMNASKLKRALAVGALCVYVAAELIQFQPNEYDNNKLFYVAFILMVPLVGRYLVDIYDRLKGIPGRKWIAGVFLFVSLVSGGLTIGREIVSDYELYSANETAAAEYVNEQHIQRATFATGSQHNNPMSSLAGQKLVCGTPTFLYFHGVDYSAQQQAVSNMFENPIANVHLFTRYRVDYLYISAYERAEFDIDYEGLNSLFSLWYDNGEVTIYSMKAPGEGTEEASEAVSAEIEPATPEASVEPEASVAQATSATAESA